MSRLLYNIIIELEIISHCIRTTLFFFLQFLRPLVTFLYRPTDSARPLSLQPVIIQGVLTVIGYGAAAQNEVSDL